MAKDFDTSSDMIPEVGSEVSKDAGADYGGDIAGDDGVDLNAETQSLSKCGKRGLAAGMAGLGVATAPFAPLHGQSMDMNNPESILGPRTEIHAPAPERPPSPLDEVAGIGATIEQGEPAPDNRDMQPFGGRYGTSEEIEERSRGIEDRTEPEVEEPVAEQHPPDPPEGSESDENDTDKNT